MQNYQNMVFSTAMRLVANHAEAEDIAQEVFLRAYQRFAELRESPTAGGWLKTVARNLSLNHLSRYRSRWSFFSELFRGENDEEREIEIPGPENVEEDLAQSERRDLVEQLLQKLPPVQRVPLVLYHMEGLSYEEIAAKLDVSLGKVKTDIFRGREALRKKLRLTMGQELLPGKANYLPSSMSQEYEKRLEAAIDRELKALQDLPAPRTLAPRIMAAIAARAPVPWYRQSWQMWPVPLRAGFPGALAGSVRWALLRQLEVAASRRCGRCPGDRRELVLGSNGDLECGERYPRSARIGRETTWGRFPICVFCGAHAGLCHVRRARHALCAAGPGAALRESFYAKCSKKKCAIGARGVCALIRHVAFGPGARRRGSGHNKGLRDDQRCASGLWNSGGRARDKFECPCRRGAGGAARPARAHTPPGRADAGGIIPVRCGSAGHRCIRPRCGVEGGRFSRDGGGDWRVGKNSRPSSGRRRGDWRRRGSGWESGGRSGGSDGQRQGRAGGRPPAAMWLR